MSDGLWFVMPPADSMTDLACCPSGFLTECPDANNRYILRDRRFFVRIAVIVVQTGATYGKAKARPYRRWREDTTAKAVKELFLSE
jgi:hypothetical protein